MTSPIRLQPVTALPAAAERELNFLLHNAAQANVAAAVGLTTHTRISDGLSTVASGQRDGYLDAFSALKVLRWARAYAPLAQAIRDYLDGETDAAGEKQLAESLRAEIGADAEGIQKINKALADGRLSRGERVALGLELRRAVDRKTKAIRAIEKSLGGPRD